MTEWKTSRWIAIASLAVTLCAVGMFRSRAAAPGAPAGARSSIAPPRPDGVALRTPARARGADAPALEAAAETPSEPSWDGEGEPSRDYVRGRLTALAAAQRPDRPLNSGQLESAVDAALRQHDARRELAALDTGPESRARRGELQARELRAAEEMRAILELPPADVPRLR